MDIYVYLSILGIELIFYLEMAVSYSFAIVCQMAPIPCLCLWFAVEKQFSTRKNMAQLTDGMMQEMVFKADHAWYFSTDLPYVLLLIDKQ